MKIKILQYMLVVVLDVVGVLSVQAQTLPVITSTSAVRQVVNIGEMGSLIVTAVSPTPATYQWKRNGLPIAGATQTALSIPGALPTRDTGWYQFVATNASGSTTSRVMFVNVVVPQAQVVAWGDN